MIEPFLKGRLREEYVALFLFKDSLESLSLQCCSLAWELRGMGKVMGGSWVTNRREAWRWCKKREQVRREEGLERKTTDKVNKLGLR